MADRAKASRARQELVATEQARAAHVRELLASDVMVDGSFVTLSRKCGKPNCHCAFGEKHLAKYVSRKIAGRTKLTYVPAANELEVSTKAERYRKLRQARAELVKLAARTAELADELQVSLVEPLPIKDEARPSRNGRRSR